jgi:thymidylate synthase ThyX
MKSPSELITAKIIADSESDEGIRMTTMEIEYPRFILSELNTHRMLSKNSASSRAIPVKAMHEHIRANTAAPISWGINQPGMKASISLDTEDALEVLMLWDQARDNALDISLQLADLNIHKQITNRITEPFMIMKTVISGTEWANFFWLRDHPDAQPEIQELASKMKAAMDASQPEYLAANEWHLPYVRSVRNRFGTLEYLDATGEPMTLVDARVVSASCCAQVSYRKNDDSLDKAWRVFKQLIESVPAHASPIEHQATPMATEVMYRFEPETWQEGVTHVSAKSDLWSGNLRGWIQFRKMIPTEAKW